MRGREALKQWIDGGLKAVLPDLHFAIAVGPVATEDYFAVRWIAQGTYAGGFPGASEDAIGSVIRFTGTDLVRVLNGVLVEYWLNADLLQVLTQLGVSELAGARN
jgi:predicted ester cyclase